MDRNAIRKLEKLLAQLESLFADCSELTKSKPDEAASEFRKTIVQRTLQTAHDELDAEYRPFADVPTLGGNAVNSDVTLLLRQYVTCFERKRADNVRQHHGKWCWVVDGQPPEHVPVVRPSDVSAATK